MHLKVSEFDQEGKTVLNPTPPNGTEYIPGSWLETTQSNNSSQLKTC